MGFKEQSLTSKRSLKEWKTWKRNNCQPNYWINVTPDPAKYCGPYKPTTEVCDVNHEVSENEHSHDTIGMIAIDSEGRMAVGTSTNGLKFKISGRVGDSPIPGAGAYVDQEIGGAACTGDGDVTMRFAPTYQVVQNLKLGMNPTEAAASVIRTIAAKYPNNQAALVVATIDGEYGAACYNFPDFPYAVRNEMMGDTKIAGAYVDQEIGGAACAGDGDVTMRFAPT
ncbi:putative N(4)-(beta-N-acetylglucosaminyl)-L-asparaginase-like protein [Leptotrombidium deliense]|uniref:N(4)-(beta-N-acetylglucosaminyl)-L-asparaginase n=1 Tax=Leptotrombidium deliense TaxID=299467 RepID=A0A443S3H5_9ACAR|nr:putative N(4)-(beta-N-acetylglucosaminyl)-L-asparaginase-like protein [Leptotrombidium deliense]